MSWSPNKAGFISKNNSSAIPLSANGKFTGIADAVASFCSITVSVFCDVAGTLSMESSSDGTHWDFKKSIKVPSGGDNHTLLITARYFRIVFTNGSVGQNEFRLQTMYHSTKNKNKVSTKSEIISDQNDVQLVRTVNDHHLDMARKRLSDMGSSYYPGVTTTLTTTEGFMGGIVAFLTTAKSIRVKSGGHANDSVSGSGARLLLVTGIDANFTPIYDVIALAGAQASSATTNKYLRVFTIEVQAVGTYSGANDGIIVVETTTGVPLIKMLAGYGKASSANYCVPKGKKMYLTKMEMLIEDNSPVHVRLWKRDNADITTGNMSSKKIVKSFDKISGKFVVNFSSYLEYGEKTDLWATGKSISGTSDINISYDVIFTDA